MEQAYAAAGIEPPLEELLGDQIAQLIMRRDGISLTDVWRAVELARSRLANRARPDAAERREPEPRLEAPEPRGAAAPIMQSVARSSTSSRRAPT